VCAEGAVVEGLLVQKNFINRLLDPHDLATYTQLRRGAMAQRMSFPFHQPLEALKAFLEEIFVRYDHKAGARMSVIIQLIDKFGLWGRRLEEIHGDQPGTKGFLVNEVPRLPVQVVPRLTVQTLMGASVRINA
jgi:hypothetical protein